jgi:hypothetical protein
MAYTTLIWYVIDKSEVSTENAEYRQRKLELRLGHDQLDGAEIRITVEGSFFLSVAPLSTPIGW